MTYDLEREARKAARAEKRWKVYTWIVSALVFVPCIAGCIAGLAIIIAW